jgi:hypothetical protein
MEERHHNADRVLCVISGAYLEKPYSKLERQSGQWAAVTTRPNFVLRGAKSANPRPWNEPSGFLFPLKANPPRSKRRWLCGFAGLLATAGK